MIPLKVAILWHFHQPYYKKENEFIMPWVRLHGVKDYFDVPELFHEFPSLKQTINIVPSLRLQIEEYLQGKTIDKIQRLTLKKPAELTTDDKSEIIRLFFMCNVDNMIMPYGRYRELFEKSRSAANAVKNFTDQEWLDLQVWYNLTWIGQFSRQKNAVKRMFRKEKNFSEEEKNLVLSVHNEILSQIKSQLRTLTKLGQLEVSYSPMYHPILPLVYDTQSARESMPDVIMPEPPFEYPDDAKAQIINGLEYVKNSLGIQPSGMWPSEGSISDNVLELIAVAGIKWVASDEDILINSLKSKYSYPDKYFPRKFRTKGGDIAVMFRDHQLSDLIGFTYSNWNGFDAASNFCHKLRQIRQDLINAYGEECLKHAVVPVILDGENCWEYYFEDGVHFRRDLFKQLTESTEFRTVTFSEATKAEHLNYLPAIDHINAGSWINANFKIWIGHEEDRAGWAMLAKARKTLESAKNTLSVQDYIKALEEIFIAEGSDWFWWYGDEHVTENKNEFDELFRWHIEQVYRISGVEPPADVFVPVHEIRKTAFLIEQSGDVNPIIDGLMNDEKEWQYAGYLDAAAAMSSMHQIGAVLLRFWYASDTKNAFFRIDTTHKLKSNETIEIVINAARRIRLVIEKKIVSLVSDIPFSLNSFRYACDDIIEIELSRNAIFDNFHEAKQEAEIKITTRTANGEISYPRQGNIKVSI